MKLVVQRQPSAQGATIGRLSVNGVFACYTLEDWIREIPGQPVEKWKVKGATAIPQGKYNVTLEDSKRFGPSTLTINHVPGFSYIRMHSGNDKSHTDGCLLLGMEATDHTLVGGTSRPAVTLVKLMVLAALKAGEPVTIEIRNPETKHV